MCIQKGTENGFENWWLLRAGLFTGNTGNNRQTGTKIHDQTTVFEFALQWLLSQLNYVYTTGRVMTKARAVQKRFWPDS